MAERLDRVRQWWPSRHTRRPVVISPAVRSMALVNRSRSRLIHRLMEWFCTNASTNSTGSSPKISRIGVSSDRDRERGAT